LFRQNWQIYVKLTSRLKQTAAFFRAHMNTAQNLLNFAPRGIPQGNSPVKNEILVM